MITSVSTLASGKRSGHAGDGRDLLHAPLLAGNSPTMCPASAQAAATDRARQMRARTGTLTAHEVAVGRRHAALTGRHRFPVGTDAHRAARAAPVEAGLDVDAVQPLELGSTPHIFRARHHPGRDMRRHLPAAHRRGSSAQVLEPAVGARADEHAVDRRAGNRLARLQAHVFQRLRDRRRGGRVRRTGRIGHPLVQRDAVLGTGAPGDLRRDRGGVDALLAIEPGAGVAAPAHARTPRPRATGSRVAQTGDP